MVWSFIASSRSKGLRLRRADNQRACADPAPSCWTVLPGGVGPQPTGRRVTTDSSRSLKLILSTLHLLPCHQSWTLLGVRRRDSSHCVHLLRACCRRRFN